MSKAVIKLAPSNVFRDCAFCADVKSLVKSKVELYTVMPAINTVFSGEEAAEEMFDLTNNPSRQSEREELYGRYRSVSVGDIVEVDSVSYVCDSFGWKVVD